MVDVMDIDGPEFIKEVNAQIATIRSSNHNNSVDISLFNSDHKDIQNFSKVAVIDTNFLISNLAYLQSLLEIAEKNYGSLLILIPWIVIKELDNLKNNRRVDQGKDNVNILSRQAMKFLEIQLRNKAKSLRGQKMHETMKKYSLQYKDDRLKGDDLILDCCMYFHSLASQEVILLSNDRNLCIKVMVHNIDSLSAASKSKMEEFAKSANTKSSVKIDHLLVRQTPRIVVAEEDHSMEIDDEYTPYEEDMVIDESGYNIINDQPIRYGSSESMWAKETPTLVAPRRPTPLPFTIDPPMAVSKNSTWASIHAPKHY